MLRLRILAPRPELAGSGMSDLGRAP